MRLGGVAVATAGAVLIAGCGVVDGLAGRDATSEPRIATVAVLVPGSGTQAEEGSAVVAAVELALAGVDAPGWTVEVERVDDGGSGSGASTAASEIGADRTVIGVIGGLSSDVVRAAQPALDRARIPFISPADDAVEHTRGADPTAPQRPYSTYFRTAAPGVDDRDAILDYAVHGLGAEVIAVVTDERVDEVSRIARAARQRSVDVVAAERGDVAGAVSAAREAEARVLYVAGSTEFVAEVATAVVSAGLDATVLTGPDVRGDDFLLAAGSAGTGTVAFAPATADPIDSMPVPGLDDAGRYGAAAYDAASALAVALERCLPPVRDEPARGARRGCLSELASVSFDGITGEVAFDDFGERLGTAPTGYVVADGAWRELGTS